VADADRGVELHTLAGVGICLYCGLNVLATPDDPPGAGSVVFCGGCAGLHLLAESRLFPGKPMVVKPAPAELLELLRRPDVRAVRDAYQLDQMEARMSRSSTKDKSKPSAPRTGGKVRLGQNRLEARGPDA